MEGDREKILNSGFDGYLSKPVNSVSVVQELGRLLDHSVMQSVPPFQPSETQDAKRPAPAKGNRRPKS
jgi:hypothetical protein